MRPRHRTDVTNPHLPSPRGSAASGLRAFTITDVATWSCCSDGSDARIHKAGFVIHSAVHGARHDVGCVIHTHSTAGIAISMLKDGLLPLSQFAFIALR